MTETIDPPIRLGAPVELYPGEWLHSAISRWAWQTFGVSRAALFEAFGLSRCSGSVIAALGTRLLPEIAANISHATGIDERRLREATMESLMDTMLMFGERAYGRPAPTGSRPGPWSWQAGTRYCSDCLRQQPGVFYLLWRSAWTFLCTTHRRILLDACSECQQKLVEMRGRNTDVFDPSTCRASIAPKGATRRIPCRAMLENSWEHLRLEEESMPMTAQRIIFASDVVHTSSVSLSLIQSAATGLRGGKQFDLIGLLSGLEESELRGLIDEEKHVGITAPKNAYAMAGLVSAGLALIRAPENDDSNRIIRRATFSRPPDPVPRGSGYGPGSPHQLLSRWGIPPEPLRARILRAHDQDLTVSQRVIWDTAVDARTLAAHRPGLGHSPSTVVPEQLWPAWCSRLDVGGAIDGTTLATALGVAVRASGHFYGPNDERAEKNLSRILRPSILGTSDQTDGLLAGISELAHTVGQSDQVLDYERRMLLPAAELLPEDHWEALADSINADPGAQRRHRNARRYLWLRLTASGVHKLPSELRIGLTRGDSAEYTDFCTRMTAELQGALNRYGQAFLHQQGIWEPVTWIPEVVARVDWPGTEINDLDVDLLHSMLLDGIVTHRRLAESLGVSTRRVVRAIDAVPPVSGRKVRPVDWQKLLLPHVREQANR